MDCDSASDLTAARLFALDAESDRLHEKRLACLWDQARLIAASPGFDAQFTENDQFRQQYVKITGICGDESVLESADVPDVSRVQLRAYSRVLSVLERVYLCRLLARLAGYRSFPASSFPFFLRGEAEEGENRISYFRNYYADAAYRRFSAALRDPTVIYAGSFSAVCEDVYYSRARACILPIENNTEGILMSFRQLIIKYDLKIVSACDIASSDDGITRFALLQKSMEAPPPGSAEVYFRFTLFMSSAILLQDVLTAADAFGLKLYRINAVPVSFSDREFSYDITIRLPNESADFPGFYCFLSLEVPQFTPMGLYPHLK